MKSKYSGQMKTILRQRAGKEKRDVAPESIGGYLPFRGQFTINNK